MSGAARVLHIASHMGGGVGRALSELAIYNRSAATGIEDAFACLESPQDARYARRIEESGADILIAPDMPALLREIAAADIVQIEWWHHPLMLRYFGALKDVAARWVVWSHTSGLHYPAIPYAFNRAPQAFIATTTASLPLLDQKGKARGNILACVASTGGFDDFPAPSGARPATCGYLGALNPAKIHPDMAGCLEEAAKPGFGVDIYGDSSVNPDFENFARKHDYVRLHGFTSKPQDVLPGIGIFTYLLNPLHYGTTENALLESMACGAVPVVWNNPVETAIVENNATGFVVDNRKAFTTAIWRLLDDAALRQKMGSAAAQKVRRDYSVAASAEKLAGIYRDVMRRDKQKADFAVAFGKTPHEMFLAGLGDYAACFTQGDEGAAQRRALPFLYEKSKSSAYHFHETFPEDAQLAAWVKMLDKDRRIIESEQAVPKAI
ncbi:MAG: glycosyltransferase [Alphaproteobacteria bacterium]|nr:glycosyltransferase [Alphaproteobacteria bacterium]